MAENPPPPSSRVTSTRTLPESLLQSFAHRGLRAGDRLPTEEELTRRHGVSRPTLRQALKVLEFSGLIESAPRRGSVLKQANPQALGSLFAAHVALHPVDDRGGPPDELAALAEARWILERSIAETAAKRRNHDDLEAMHAAEQRFAEAIHRRDRRACAAADAEFHRAYVRSVHNHVFICLSGVIDGYFDSAVKRLAPYKLDDDQFWVPAWKDAQDEHRTIRAALQARDAGKLLRTLERHLHRGMEMLARSSDRPRPRKKT
jgi:GntR family transcriptional regulator, transcriptional repressor for pyruvate dehydrogenase complex